MPSLLSGVDFDALKDEEDCLRRVLSEMSVPRSIAELKAILVAYASSGMRTVLPGTKRLHADVCDVKKIIVTLEKAGWIHKIIGDTWQQLADHTDGLASTLSHDFPDGDGGRINRVQEWADSEERAAWDPKADHWAMTHSGFEQLTGHKQGERPAPVADADDIDPSEITPASIGDA